VRRGVGPAGGQLLCEYVKYFDIVEYVRRGAGPAGGQSLCEYVKHFEIGEYVKYLYVM